MHDPRTPVRYVRARSDIVAALGWFFNNSGMKFQRSRHYKAKRWCNSAGHQWNGKPTKVPPFRKHIAGLDQSSLNSFFAYVTKSYTQTDQKSSDTKQKKLRRHSGQGFKASIWLAEGAILETSIWKTPYTRHIICLQSSKALEFEYSSSKLKSQPKRRISNDDLLMVRKKSLLS